MKTCSSCGEEKPLTEYNVDRSKACGRCTYCKTCATTRAKQHQARQREEWSCWTDDEIRQYTPEKPCSMCKRVLPSSEYVIDRGKSRGLESRCRTCSIIGARKRAAKRAGVPATLTWGEIGDPPDTCPCCGVTMERANGDRGTSPSLDRLEPERGYVKDNAVWICAACNSVKWETTPSTLWRLYAMGDWLYEEYRKRGIPCPTRLRPLSSRAD